MRPTVEVILPVMRLRRPVGDAENAPEGSWTLRFAVNDRRAVIAMAAGNAVGAIPPC